MFRSILPNSKPKRIKDVIERKEDDKLIILYRSHSLLVMNAYAAEIWKLCNGEHTVEEIVKFVNNKYGVPVEEAKKEIISFLTRLMEKGLITFHEGEKH